MLATPSIFEKFFVVVRKDDLPPALPYKYLNGIMMWERARAVI